MRNNVTVIGATALSLMLMVSHATADKRLVGGIIGFGIGVAVGKAISDQNSNNQNRQSKSRGSQQRQVRPPTQQEIERAAALERQRENVRDIQRRLNALNFDAGTPDGALGPRSRRAISSFQASIGRPVTGTLTPEETSILFARTNPGSAPIEASTPGQLSPHGFAGTSPLVEQQARPDLPDLVDIGLVPPESSVATQRGVSAVYTTGSFDEGDTPAVAILGMQPLDDLRDTRVILQEAGFDNCEQQGHLLTCAQSANGMDDRLMIGFANENGQDKVHTLARRLTFATPVARADVISQLAGSYAAILDAPDMVIAASPACSSFARNMRESGFSELLDWAKSGEPANGPTSALAAKCDYHYSLDLPAGGDIGSISITLFNGGPIMHALTEGTLGSQNTRTGPQIRF